MITILTLSRRMTNLPCIPTSQHIKLHMLSINYYKIIYSLQNDERKYYDFVTLISLFVGYVEKKNYASASSSKGLEVCSCLVFQCPWA